MSKMAELQNAEVRIREVAERISHLREDLSISVEEMAVNTGYSVEDYKKFESGERDFSFTFIYKCANTFNVDITDLMEGSSPELSGYTITRKGEGVPIVRRKGFAYNRLASKFKNKIVEPFHVVIPYSEEALSQPLHMASHAGQEMDIVIKGTVRMTVGSHTEILHEGDCIYYDSSMPHAGVALGPGIGLLLTEDLIDNARLLICLLLALQEHADRRLPVAENSVIQIAAFTENHRLSSFLTARSVREPSSRSSRSR